MCLELLFINVLCFVMGGIIGAVFAYAVMMNWFFDRVEDIEFKDGRDK